MPRSTHTIFKIERKGRSSYFQAHVKGKPVHLGIDRRVAKARLAAMLASDQATDDRERPSFVAGLIRSYLSHNPRMPAWKPDAWCAFADEGALPLSEIRADHLSEFHERLKESIYRRIGKGGKPGPAKHYTPQTIRHYLSAASMILTWAYKHGWIQAMPVRPKTTTPRQTPRDLPLETVQRLLDALPEPTQSIARFIFSVGCRPSEACKLRWAWYRPGQNGCGSFVMPLDSHKTGERIAASKTIYLTPDAQAIIDRMPRDRAIVFLNRAGRPFTADGIQSATSRRGITQPYALRHTFATNALARGTPLHIVSELLGHRNIATTQKYARVMSPQASAAASALGQLLPAPVAGDPEPKVSDATISPPQRRTSRRSRG